MCRHGIKQFNARRQLSSKRVHISSQTYQDGAHGGSHLDDPLHRTSGTAGYRVVDGGQRKCSAPTLSSTHSAPITGPKISSTTRRLAVSGLYIHPFQGYSRFHPSRCRAFVGIIRVRALHPGGWMDGCILLNPLNRATVCATRCGSDGMRFSPTATASISVQLLRE